MAASTPNNTAIRTKILLLVAPLVLFLVFLNLSFYLQNLTLKKELLINSFTDCTNSPGSIMQESDPPVCVTLTGRKFTGELAHGNTKQNIDTMKFNIYAGSIEGWLKIDFPEHNFSVEIPDGENRLCGETTYPVSFSSSSVHLVPGHPCAGESLEIEVFERQTDLTTEKFIEENLAATLSNAYLLSSTREPSVIGNIPATKINNVYYIEYGDGEGEEVKYFLKHKSHFLVITRYPEDSLFDFSEDTDQVLSTFMFY